MKDKQLKQIQRINYSTFWKNCNSIVFYTTILYCKHFIFSCEASSTFHNLDDWLAVRQLALFPVPRRHFSMEKVDLGGMVDTIDMVNNMNMVDNMDMVDNRV